MIDVNYNEYKETIADNMKLIQENHKLKERIDKAIEYMKIFVDFDECIINGKSFQKAIDILKGDSNNE